MTIVDDAIRWLRSLDWAVGLAIWGAFTGTIASVRVYRIDRPRLNLRLETFHPDADPMDARDLGPTYVRLNVTNKGRRPVTIANIGLLLRPARRYWPPKAGWVTDRHEYLTIDKDQPRKLSEGEHLFADEVEDGVIGQLAYNLPGPYRLHSVWARDTTGKWHRARVNRRWRGLGHEPWREEGLAQRKPVRSRLSLIRPLLLAKWRVVRDRFGLADDT